MTTGYHRKKEPELVKQKLLQAAVELGVEQGVSCITVQAVADRAGVTKGGLLHHFPSKNDLVDGVCHHLLAGFDAELEEHLKKDSGTYGCFTRAYVRTIFADQWDQGENPWAAPMATLAIATVGEPSLRKIWFDWMKNHLQRHKKTDSDFELEVARLAADGAWLNLLDGPEQAAGLMNPKIKEKLLALTRGKSKKKT